MSLTAIFLSAAALAAQLPQESTITRRPGEVQVNCIVSMVQNARLAAREAGPIVEVHVKEGAIVKKGDVLAQQDDRDVQFKKRAAHKEFEVAREQSVRTLVVAAELAAEAAKAEHEQNLDINRRSPGGVSLSELRKSDLNAKHSRAKIEVEELQWRVAVKTAEAKEVAEQAADEEILRRKVIAPINGIVDRVLVHVGDWVQPGQPVAEIVRVDKLRVDALLNINEVSDADVVGRPVEIEIPMANGQVEKVTGKIGFVSKVVVANGRYRIWAEFDNREVDGYWVISPGVKATMTIKLARGTTPAARPQRGP